MRPRSDTFVIEEWERIFRQYNAFENWLGENPTGDSGVLSEVYHPDGPRFTARKEGLKTVRQEGLTVVNAGFGKLLLLGRLSESDELDDDRVVVLVSTTSEGAKVYNREGQVVETVPGWREQAFEIDFRKVPDGRWLVWDWMEFTP